MPLSLGETSFSLSFFLSIQQARPSLSRRFDNVASSRCPKRFGGDHLDKDTHEIAKPHTTIPSRFVFCLARSLNTLARQQFIADSLFTHQCISHNWRWCPPYWQLVARYSHVHVVFPCRLQAPEVKRGALLCCLGVIILQTTEYMQRMESVCANS